MSERLTIQRRLDELVDMVEEYRDLQLAHQPYGLNDRDAGEMLWAALTGSFAVPDRVDVSAVGMSNASYDRRGHAERERMTDVFLAACARLAIIQNAAKALRINEHTADELMALSPHRDDGAHIIAGA